VLNSIQQYTCPVCCGRGTVQSGFYNQSSITITLDTTEETCRSCGGSGVVWKRFDSFENEIVVHFGQGE